MPRVSLRWLLLVMVAPISAWADEFDRDDGSDGGAARAAVVNRVNLRAGAASTDTTGRPTICVDVRVVWKIGIEGCGTGQGVIHDEAGIEMAHFRATYSLLERPLWKGTGVLRGGLGFAEMQVGVDHPGFQFGSPDADRGSVAGPEASLSAQMLLPLHRGLDFVMTGTAGLAYFSGADELIRTKSDLQPFVSLEAGVGW
ncbi:MAG: hypothetical protein AB7R00_18585 [Kofleriaceae bacterium]